MQSMHGELNVYLKNQKYTFLYCTQILLVGISSDEGTFVNVNIILWMIQEHHVVRLTLACACHHGSINLVNRSIIIELQTDFVRELFLQVYCTNL